MDLERVLAKTDAIFILPLQGCNDKRGAARCDAPDSHAGKFCEPHFSNRISERDQYSPHTHKFDCPDFPNRGLTIN